MTPRGKRLRKRLRRSARRAAEACYAAAGRRAPGSTAARALNRAGATIAARSKWLDRRLGERPAASSVAAEHEQLAEVVWRHRIEVGQPLVLISQIHRSGGTLLTRLFDDHPQLYTIPHELGPLLPHRQVPLDPSHAWGRLADPKLRRQFTHGARQARPDLNRDESVFRMLLPPLLHRRLFDRMLEHGARRERDVLDAYVTAYFNGWLDYRGFAPGKKWVVGFEPGALTQEKRLRRFGERYPDGRIVSIVRDPWSWYVSARLWDHRFAAIGPALEDWRRALQAALDLKSAQPDRVRLVGFDALVRATEHTLRELAAWLEIDFEPTLLEPTFNGHPANPNSSFPGEGPRVSGTPATERRRLLDPEDERLIAEQVGRLYEEALEQLDVRAEIVA